MTVVRHVYQGLGLTLQAQSLEPQKDTEHFTAEEYLGDECASIWTSIAQPNDWMP
jgi:hypothetical protein